MPPKSSAAASCTLRTLAGAAAVALSAAVRAAATAGPAGFLPAAVLVVAPQLPGVWRPPLLLPPPQPGVLRPLLLLLPPPATTPPLSPPHTPLPLLLPPLAVLGTPSRRSWRRRSSSLAIRRLSQGVTPTMCSKSATMRALTRQSRALSALSAGLVLNCGPQRLGKAKGE